MSEAPPLRDPAVPDISVLVVTWNSAPWIERCLAAVGPACGTTRHEIIVYDNASDDDTLLKVAGRARVTRGSSNDSFAAAINHAFASSHGRHVCLLNPDCELAPGALAVLTDYLDAHRDVAAVVPLLEDEGGESQREFQLRRLPTLGSLAVELLMVDKLFPGNPISARYRYRDLTLDAPQPVEQPAAAALLIRRETVEAIGPFDEQFAPAWFEDVDYCRRLFEAGRPIHLVPAARGRHYGGASLNSMSFTRFTEIWYRNMWRYASKWFRPGQRELLRWLVVAGMLLRCLVGLAGLRPRGVGRGEAYRAYSGVLRKAIERWPGSSPSSS